MGRRLNEGLSTFGLAHDMSVENFLNTYSDMVRPSPLFLVLVPQLDGIGAGRVGSRVSELSRKPDTKLNTREQASDHVCCYFCLELWIGSDQLSQSSYPVTPWSYEPNKPFSSKLLF